MFAWKSWSTVSTLFPQRGTMGSCASSRWIRTRRRGTDLMDKPSSLHFFWASAIGSKWITCWERPEARNCFAMSHVLRDNLAQKWIPFSQRKRNNQYAGYPLSSRIRSPGVKCAQCLKTKSRSPVCKESISASTVIWLRTSKQWDTLASAYGSACRSGTVPKDSLATRRKSCHVLE